MSKTFDRKDVYSVLNAEDASQYVGTKGYFADTLSCLNEKVRKNMLDPLDDVNQLHDFPFISYVTGFLFFLPADKVKEVEEEKKWRAFKDIEEFKKETGLGLLSIVRYRYIIEKPRITTTTGFGVITDFSTCCGTYYITIGDTSFNLDELFNYEYLDKHSNWQPFGVEE